MQLNKHEKLRDISSVQRKHEHESYQNITTITLYDFQNEHVHGHVIGAEHQLGTPVFAA
jgi:hypothetical protein